MITENKDQESEVSELPPFCRNKLPGNHNK